MKLKRTIVTSLLIGVFTFPAFAGKKTAILPFEVISIKPEIKQFGYDISENVSNALSTVPALFMIEQNQIENIMNELSLKAVNLASDNNAIKIGKYLEAEILVPGSLEIDKGYYKLLVKFISVKTGKVLKSSLISGKDIFDLQEKLATEIINQQKIKLKKEEKDRLIKIIRATKSSKALKFYLQGINLIQLGASANFDEAIKLFNKALAEDKNYYFALAERAKAQALWAFQQKQNQDLNYRHLISQAEEDINQVLSKSSGLTEVFKTLSLISYFNEDYNKGQRLAKTVLQINPHDGEAYFFLWLNNGKKLEDKSIYKAIELNPFLPLFHAQLALAYQNKAKTEEAMKEFQEALRLNPDNASIHYNIGNIYLKTGRLNEAISKFKETLKIEPDLWLGYSGLAESYKLQDKIDDAVDSYRASLKINPNNPDAHLQLGNIYTEQGELDDAVKQYKDSISLNPDNPETHYNLGIVYKFQDKIEEAISEYKEAIRLKPDFSEAYYNLGIAYKYQGKYDEAINEYRKTIKIHPDFAEARLNLGVIYFEQNKVDEAIKEFKEAIRIKPDYARARINLGSAYQKDGKLDMAIAEYKEALKINPNYASAHFNLGRVYNQLKKTKEAVASLKKACELGYKPACK